MHTSAPAPDEIRSLIGAAVAAPSVHNTQPWLFAVDGPRISVLADHSRQLLAQDPQGRALVISCGAALLNLRVAAVHLGYQVQVELIPDDARPDLLASVSLQRDSVESGMATTLWAAIAQRHTNRMPYEDRPVPQPMLDSLVEAARHESADLLVVSSPEDRRRLSELMHEADVDLSPDSQRKVESQQWVGVESSRRDGVPASALGPIPMSAATPHRDLALGTAVVGRSFAVFETDPTLAVLTTRGDRVRDWLVAGQALQRVLLVATIEGLVATFANQALEAPTLRWLVRDPDSGIGFPQMLMRLGYAPPAPATPRRPIEDVIVSQ